MLLEIQTFVLVHECTFKVLLRFFFLLLLISYRVLLGRYSRSPVLPFFSVVFWRKRHLKAHAFAYHHYQTLLVLREACYNQQQPRVSLFSSTLSALMKRLKIVRVVPLVTLLKLVYFKKIYFTLICMHVLVCMSVFHVCAGA